MPSDIDRLSLHERDGIFSIFQVANISYHFRVALPGEESIHGCGNGLDHRRCCLPNHELLHKQKRNHQYNGDLA